MSCDLEPMLTPAEVAELLSVHRSTISRWVKAGVLPAVHLTATTYRFLRTDVEAIADRVVTREDAA